MRRGPALVSVVVALALVLALVLAPVFTAAGVGATGLGTVAAESPSGDAAHVSADDTNGILVDAPATSADACTPDTDTEVVGCWKGVAHDDPLPFNQSTGLSAAQLETLTHRSMARVEYVRERPFESDIPVETVTRTEFQSNGTGTDRGEQNATRDEFNRWNDQVWKALFIIGETESSATAIDTVFGGSVSGFYSPSGDRIVLVVPEGEAVRVSESTLVHELTHGMQDQYHDLTAGRYVGATQDSDLAVDGLIEGEAVYIEERYTERCGAEWQCLTPPESGGSGAPSFNIGILQTVLQPYADGPFYVERLLDTGGWDAVDSAMDDPPSSTAAVIHRDPGYETAAVEFEDTATNGWRTYLDRGVNGAETAGEASMFVMFWYQSFADSPQAPVLDPTASARQNVRLHLRTDEQLQTRRAYNYAHPATTGWAGDKLYPYRDDTGDATQNGYVWATAWQTPTDAAEFEAAYHRLLSAHDATRQTDGTRVITSGGFQGAYGVERDGTRVTIVHAPTAEGVFELRPGLAPRASVSADAPASTADGGSASTTAESGSADTAEAGSTSSAAADEGATVGQAPGLGVLVAVIAVLTLALFFRRRSRR